MNVDYISFTQFSFSKHIFLIHSLRMHLRKQVLQPAGHCIGHQWWNGVAGGGVGGRRAGNVRGGNSVC